MNLKYEIIGDDFLSAGEASTKIKRILRKIGVDPQVLRRIAIAVYEAEMNVAIHAKKGEILVDVLKDKIIIEVKDEGPGIQDISLAMQEGYSTAPDEARRQGFGAGMGLPNIKKTADSFEINSELGIGTDLSMIFYL